MPDSSSKSPAPAQPITLTPTQGESFNIIGGGVRFLIDGQSSGGRCVIWEAPVPAGDGPPLHRHEREDELFYIIEGRFKFSIDGKIFFAEPGAFASAPRGSIHTFKNVGRTPGKLLITCTPAGIEETFRAVQLPTPGTGRLPPTMDEMIASFTRHGITFHGPPLNED